MAYDINKNLIAHLNLRNLKLARIDRQFSYGDTVGALYLAGLNIAY